MTNPDWDDPQVVDKWCLDARRYVREYLAKEGVDHGEIGEWPAWQVAPCASVWAVESLSCPGSVGWWVIYGDLPTDYVSAAEIGHPRDAVAKFSKRWLGYRSSCEQGRKPTDFVVGDGSEELLKLLESRATMLADWARDDAIWKGI